MGNNQERDPLQQSYLSRKFSPEKIPRRRRETKPKKRKKRTEGYINQYSQSKHDSVRHNQLRTYGNHSRKRMSAKQKKQKQSEYFKEKSNHLNKEQERMKTQNINVPNGLTPAKMTNKKNPKKRYSK